jgi:hypothetical protein
MRIRIYLERVKEKMVEWHFQGESLLFEQARADDLMQFMDMLGTCHVHHMPKEEFWGIWNAAAVTQDQANISASIATANATFRLKYFNESNGKATTKKAR